jgi:hypothetical protein
MARTMADRLSEARRQSFVGRTDQLALFEALLQATDQPALVYVHGPGGIGKTTLLRHFAARCEELGQYCLQIDARDIPPTIDALAFRLSKVLGESAPAARAVVLLDGYELLTDLDGPFREQLAPQLPVDAILVIASHHPPSAGWRTDPGWAPLLHVHKLSNLDRADALSFLAGRGVPAELQEPAMDFTHGHPLALALVGEVVRQKGSLAPADSADVIHLLMDRLLAAIPGREHRAALEAAALVRVLDEPLLATLLATPDATELFGWMRRLPFVDVGASGLVLHDMARAVLAADLRWRHGQRYVELHDRARRHYLARLESADPMAQAGVLLDLIYLHPDLRPFLQAPSDGDLLRIDTVHAGEETAIVAMVERHEGAESAYWSRHWLARQPAAWLVVRELAGAVVGTMCLLALDGLDATDDATDPAIAAATAELAGHPPLRPGERATLIRYWLSQKDYQSVSAVQSVIATQLARHYLTTPGLALSLLPFAHPDEWVAFCQYADLRRAPAADFVVGERQYTVFGHDWRVVPPAAWVAQLSLREVGAAPGPTVGAPAATLLVLSEAEFASAVRRALRDFTRPDRLRQNPLLKCRFITAASGGSESAADRAQLLQSLIKAAAETLAANPADRRLHRVLVRAYLSPAPSLERAAEVLELPSSTFRRLLGTAVSRVATVLWHQELDAK